MRHRKPPFQVLKHGCSVRRVAEEAGNFGFVLLVMVGDGFFPMETSEATGLNE